MKLSSRKETIFNSRILVLSVSSHLQTLALFFFFQNKGRAIHFYFSSFDSFLAYNIDRND